METLLWTLGGIYCAGYLVAAFGAALWYDRRR